MTEPKCIAVIGGEYINRTADGDEGERFDSLRLFDCQSTADLYKAELEQKYDYVLMKVLPITTS
jgi:hypothetical protein